jgi:hypothetical protein
VPLSIHIAGEPFQYEAEADAGIYLSTGERWFGTSVRWRPGISGRWQRCSLIDVHPFDFDAVEVGLREVVRRRYGLPATDGTSS